MMMEVGSDVVERAHYSSQKHVAIDIWHYRSMLP